MRLLRSADIAQFGVRLEPATLVQEGFDESRRDSGVKPGGVLSAAVRSRAVGKQNIADIAQLVVRPEPVELVQEVLNATRTSFAGWRST